MQNGCYFDKSSVRGSPVVKGKSISYSRPVLSITVATNK